MVAIRNSVKAIIIENKKLLLTVCDFKDGKTTYIFSGGGQEIGETFVQTLQRECLEELGAKVKVGELVWIREYIGKNHEFAECDSEVHQVEYYFKCQLETPVDLSKATQLDKVQIGVEWLELSRLKEYDIYPQKIKDCINEDGNIISPIYIGGVN
jgi:8-oxo-dGTP diphosphatase